MASKAATPVKPGPNGSKATFGRVWLDGQQVSRKAYADATGASDASEKLNEFAELARILADAGDNKRKRDDAMDRLESALANLGQLDRESQEKLMGNAVILQFLEMVTERRQEKGVQPGEIVGEGLSRTKMPWRMADFTHDKFDYIIYTPTENIPVTINGVTVNFFQDIPQYMPKCFYDVYMDSKIRTRGAQEHRAMMFAGKSQRDMGLHNDTPSDPSLLVGQQGMRTRMLRGGWDGGSFEPGAGMQLIVPPVDRPGFEELEGSEE